MRGDASPISTAWVCETCGVQAAPSVRPADRCPICEDERQYPGGVQRWTSAESLAKHQRIVFAEEAGVTTMVLEPGFAINQRAFLIPHAGGAVMWECLAAVTDEAVSRIEAMGGVSAIAISHPHFYAAMADWSAALGGVPIHIHADDRRWVQRPCDTLEFWDGPRLALADNIELVHLGGHFDGSAGLWWKGGPKAGGSLFPGDAIQVATDRRFATFMYSYPNAIPLDTVALAELRSRLEPLAYDDVFGFGTGRQIVGGAKAWVEASFDRFSAAIAA